MNDEFKQYPAYRDSGVKWLGNVPEHWKVRRLGNLGFFSASGIDKNIVDGEPLVKLINYLDIYNNPNRELDTDRDYQIVSCPEWKRAIHSVKQGDMFFTPSSETSEEIGFSAVCIRDLIDTVYSYHTVRFRTKDNVEIGFKKYWCNNRAVRDQFSANCKGTTRQILVRNDFRSVQVPLPTVGEQNGIAHFLDQADRRIQHYINAKQKLLQLLEEQKQAVIHQAVTGQIDARTGQRYPAYKDSGVEWLGDVPAHWQIAALHHRYSQCLGKMLDSKRITGNHLLPYLRNVDVQWDQINTMDLPTMDIAPEEYERYTVQHGDLLVCEGGEIGRCALWSGGIPRCGFQKALHRLRPRNAREDMPRYMYFALRAAAEADAFNDGHLSTIGHLTGEKLRVHRFPFPPVAEQELLVRFLDSVVERIDHTISCVHRQIDLLQEYRTRLIANVVTGKLDVRKAVAELPEEDESRDAEKSANEYGIEKDMGV